jgi:cytochrome P450
VAIPYPCVTFLELLGLPVEDLGQLLGWKELMIRDLHSGDPERVADLMQNAIPSHNAYFESKILEREAMSEECRPHDLISTVISAKHDGDVPFTLVDKTQTLNLFLGAGLDTVTGLLGFIVEFLATHPDHRRQLIEEPELIPNAVEEFFRYFGIITMFRKVMCDTMVNGVAMHRGEYIMILTQAAGRDPSEYGEPEMVDFGRRDIRHLGLGAGPHRCLGSHLARLELKIALEEITSIMPDFSIDGDPSTLSRHWGVVAGLDALPLVVTESCAIRI